MLDRSILQRVQTATASVPPHRWTVERGARARRNFVLTVIGTTLLTALFFICYFYVQRHPAYTPTVLPLTALDRMIPFQPQALSGSWHLSHVCRPAAACWHGRHPGRTGRYDRRSPSRRLAGDS